MKLPRRLAAPAGFLKAGYFIFFPIIAFIALYCMGCFRFCQEATGNLFDFQSAQVYQVTSPTMIFAYQSWKAFSVTAFPAISH